MKKIVKRMVALTCVAALAATSCVGASAKSYYGTVGGYSWSASITVLDNNRGFFRASTSGGWSIVYSSSVGVKANYNHTSGSNQTDGWRYAPNNQNNITYDCIHYPNIFSQSSEHRVTINGNTKFTTLYL